MAAFQRGVDYVESEAAKQGINYNRPAIGIVPVERDNPSFPPGIGAFGGGRIFIATWYLEEASRYSHEEPTSFFADADETLVYAGATVPDYFVLFGVEEAHHALFSQREGNWTSPTLHPNTAPSALYDAQDHEYEALQWKIEAARALGFPEETVEALQLCRQAATTVREEQSSKEHAVNSQAPTSEDHEGTAQHTSGRNTERREKTDDKQADVSPESTEILSDPNSSLHPEEQGLDEDEQEPDTHLHVEEHAPPDNGKAAGPYMHNQKDAMSYGSRDRGEQGETTSSTTQDTGRDHQDHDDGR